MGQQISRVLGFVGALVVFTSISVGQIRECRELLHRMPFSVTSQTFEFLYAVKPDGTVWWRRDQMGVGVGVSGTFRGANCSLAERVSHNLSEAKLVTSRWNRANRVHDIVQGGGNIFYIVRDNGDLDWYRHDGNFEGSDAWQGPTLVGTGWTSATRLVAMGGGIIYGQMAAGHMLWNRHENYMTGEGFYGGWTQPAVKVMGLGQYKFVFGGGRGIIYGVNDKGELVWFKHKTYSRPVEQPGAAILADWLGGKTIATGWQDFTKIFCAGHGHIYALLPSGELRFFDHQGWRDGSPNWGDEEKIGDGWGEYEFIFAGMR